MLKRKRECGQGLDAGWELDHIAKEDEDTNNTEETSKSDTSSVGPKIEHLPSDILVEILQWLDPKGKSILFGLKLYYRDRTLKIVD